MFGTRFHQRILKQGMAAMLAAVLTEAPAVAADINLIAVSLQQFTEMVVKNSLRSRTNEDNLVSSRLSWMSARRGLTLPTVKATASTAKAFSDDDVETETTRRTDVAALGLTQPFLTGTNVSVDSTWTKVRTETDVDGEVTLDNTRDVPAVVASLNQPLYVFTGNTSLRARRQADLSWANAQDSWRSERLSIEFDARSLYYNLLLQAETAQVQRDKYESSKLVNEVTRALVRAGRVAEVERVRSDIRAKSDERSIRNSESDVQKSVNEAKELILAPPESSLKLISKLNYQPFKLSLNSLLELAAQNNPGVLIAKRSVELSDISLRETREADRPLLSAAGSYALTRNRANPDFPVDPYQWEGRLVMDWTFFDATKTRLATQQAAIDLQIARRNYEDTLRDLRVSIQNTFIEIKRTEDQIVDFGSQREAADKNLQAIRLQYRNGLTRLTDVFDAENQLQELELEYLGLLVNFNTARDRMNTLVGKTL